MSRDSEAKVYPVLKEAQESAKIKGLKAYQKHYEESVNQPEEFWAAAAERLDWFHRWELVLDWNFHEARVTWYAKGRLNIAYNCLDRHLATKASKPAIIWEADEPGEGRTLTYQELHAEVCKTANVLLAHGTRKGDRVCIYMPMIPELPIVMLACARIGAIHSVVFAGFSADSLRDRIIDSNARMLVTTNEGLRGGKTIPLKNIADKALDGVNCVKSVLVSTRTDTKTNMVPGRDFWLEEELGKQRSYCPAEWMESEDPLFILYTSGSTGKPKGLMHTTAGYLVYASLTHEQVFDYQDGDIYFCAADIGWITGHSYIVYGPLANGATTLMFESTPMYPNPGRYWDTIQRHKVTIFYTAPTAIRAVAREGDSWVHQHDLTSLRVLGSVGEPINTEAWEWYYHVVGKERCPIVDTWWQTETGGIMITPQPGVTPLKPGSATLPFYGIQPELVDDQGKTIEGKGVSGNLCIQFPWPGMARSIYGDHQRFLETYFSMYPGRYFTGDGCIRDDDGYYWITGRVDDVINVSGHRLGTAEIESAINACDAVAESAVVGYPHDVKGTGIFAYIVLKKEISTLASEVPGQVKKAVAQEIGKIARPDIALVCPGLPKTRSGKIMRRILRKIAEGEYHALGNTSTLADPLIVEQLIEVHQSL